jgi:hypothetical protein
MPDADLSGKIRYVNISRDRSNPRTKQDEVTYRGRPNSGRNKTISSIKIDAATVFDLVNSISKKDKFKKSENPPKIKRYWM